MGGQALYGFSDAVADSYTLADHLRDQARHLRTAAAATRRAFVHAFSNAPRPRERRARASRPAGRTTSGDDPPPAEPRSSAAAVIAA